MEAAKVEQSGKKKVVDRKPKYIANLLKHAEIRNQEEERRKERKVQKEREAEGDEFADKEKFVTSAYRYNRKFCNAVPATYHFSPYYKV